MSIWDWLILVMPIAGLYYLLYRTRRYSRTVEDFLVGSRTGGRYLLTAADGMAGVGLISLIREGQRFYHSGWAFEWWGIGTMVVGTLLTLSGFVGYRYRETRVMTLAQLFEMRYSRRFRIAMGFVCYLSGIINFGIFPAVGASFFICFLGLPPTLCGVPTYPLLMVLFLGGACVVTLSGGQVQNMMTDTVQALLLYTMCVVVAVCVLCLFSVSEFEEALCGRPDGMSFINPFDTEGIADYNIWLFLIGLYFCVAWRGAWQGNQGYAASAISPHEAKMGSILGTWRSISLNFFILSFCLGGAAVLFTSSHRGEASALVSHLGSFLPSAVVDQMQMPLALSQMLPIGIKGIFASVLFFLMLSTDTTYIHSWGVILVQDVVLPLYGHPVSERRHLLLLRLSVLFVACFGVVFSLVYRQSEYIGLFQMLTGTIFAASAGCAILGALYWRRATVAGAWTAMVVGAVSALLFVGLLDARVWAWCREVLLSAFPGNATLLAAKEKCPLNGGWLSFISTLLAQVSFVAVSLATYRRPYDLERLLHRGPYADGERQVVVQKSRISPLKRLLFGFDEEFTLRDKLVSVSVSCWVLGWGLFFVVVTVWNVLGYLFPGSGIRMWPERWWFNYLLAFLGLHLVLSPLTAVWLTLGGYRDLRRMFELLRRRQDGAGAERGA